MSKITIKKLLRENLNIEGLLSELTDNLDFSSFMVNDKLEDNIWGEDNKLNPEIRETLIKIANDYWDSLELGFKYSDITLTGSLANYNWSRYSDVDLHIIFDANELGDNKELTKDLLDSKTRTWNSEHDITIKGYEVELYLQPEDQEHFSTAVYSILNDKWILEPKKVGVRLDKPTIRKKYKNFVKLIDDIESLNDNQIKISKIEKLKDNIKKMRKAGLETGGEFSTENIVFKLLRRNNMMDKLNDIMVTSYDKEHTINEIN